MPEASRDGRRLSWQESGRGAPMILLHAGLNRAAHWAPVIEALPPRYHMLAPDLPGHGDTDPPLGLPPQAQAMADAEWLADGRAVHLVGHSYGGTVALHLAVRRPALARSLTLIEPVYFVLAHDAGDPAFEAYLQDAAPFADACARGDNAAALDNFLAMWGSGMPLSPERRARLVARVPLVAATGAELRDPDAPGRLTLEALAAITVPLRLVRGSLSPPIIGAIHRAILRTVPGAVEEVIDGAGHMLPLTHPAAAAAAIARTAA